MHSDAVSALIISLKVALLATVLASVSGVAGARFLHNNDFTGKSALEAVFLLPMVLPPTVVGFGLLLILGRSGPLETIFQGNILFTIKAAVIASATVAFPLVYQNARAAFRKVDREQEKAARTLGVGNCGCLQQ